MPLGSLWYQLSNSISYHTSQVLLCANNRPVLNDVTYAELELILQRVSPLSEVLSDALANGKLECLDSGQVRCVIQ